MSVPKRLRKESQFEVFHHLYKTRKEITDLLLRDFGYSKDKAEKNAFRQFGGRGIEELSEQEKQRLEKIVKRNESFNDWFIEDERKAVVDLLRNITKEVFVANSIYPAFKEELSERRIHQDLTIGHCHALMQELQYSIETLPVDINKYLRFAELIEKEIDLIKGWRKSDNKFKRVISDSSASNFCNVNSNGNCNNNSASNSNGVRPDFDSATKQPLEHLAGKKGEVILPQHGKY